MARSGKNNSKKAYRRPKHDANSVAPLSQLLAKHTLRGLRDEILVNIIGLGVMHDGPIEVEEAKEIVAKLCIPFAADDHLAAIAAEEVFKVNTFSEELAVMAKPQISIWQTNKPRNKQWLPSAMKETDRLKVRHLRVRVPIELMGGEVDLAFNVRPTDFGAEDVEMLSFLPAVYPNLLTLQLDVAINHEDQREVRYVVLHTGLREIRSARLRGWELNITLLNILIAFSQYKSSGLRSKTMTLYQGGEDSVLNVSDDAGHIHLNVEDSPCVCCTLWSMMDLRSSSIDVLPLMSTTRDGLALTVKPKVIAPQRRIGPGSEPKTAMPFHFGGQEVRVALSEFSLNFATPEEAGKKHAACETVWWDQD